MGFNNSLMGEIGKSTKNKRDTKDSESEGLKGNFSMELSIKTIRWLIVILCKR